MFGMKFEFAVAAVFAVVLPAFAQTPLAKGFKDPPNIARPRVYWYWQNGNITKDGLTKDLEWMHRAGIGGVETFDVVLQTPIVVNPRLIYMQPGWKDAFRHAIQLADKLGLETTIGAAPGWSQSGGPWVKPADAMKKLVWTATAVEGGKRVQGALPMPSDVNGRFLDQPRGASGGVTLATLYKDQRVIAFRMPAGENALAQAHPSVTSSRGSFTYAGLSAGAYANPVDLPAEAGKSSWIQIAFDTPQTVRGLTIAAQNIGGASGAPLIELLEVSRDGVNFTKVIDLHNIWWVYQRTVGFAPVTGRFFRYRIISQSSTAVRLCRLQLHAAMPVHRFEEKAGFAMARDYYEIPTPEADEASVVKKSDVLDLTGKMAPDGTLAWTAPAGDWMVLRMGYSLTGATNAPAPPEATGFEVDKLNLAATRTFMKDYLKAYDEASGGMMGQHGVNNIATDSWEAGLQNWTDGILDDFKRLRGYDPTPWLPALAGWVVQSSDVSDRFLWDFRRTIMDLVITSSFEGIRDSLHERGIKYVTEAMGVPRAMVADSMEMKARADYPMGEYWLPYGDYVNRNYIADLRDTASVAHIYGKKVASAESITSTGIPWAYGPWDEKATADQILLGGINQMTLHVSVHQPNENAPGLALGPYGMWFNRLETWAEQARAWTDYIARSCFLLQQGHAVMDVAYFYGEEAPPTNINGAHAPEIIDGYNYDFVNREALVKEFSVEGGRLATKSGMKYRILYLGGTSSRMTLPVLEKVRALAVAGAVVVGLPPEETPSLSDDPARWKVVAREIWPDKAPFRKLGEGKVYQTANLSYVLGAEQIQPDFAYVKPFPDATVKFYHRVDGDTDIYFVNNRNDSATTISADFRVTGKAAEIWMADRGTMRPASYRIHDGVTTVPLALERRDAVFVVFREPAAATARTVIAPARGKLVDVGGPWEVEFQPGRGAPKSATFAELSDWSNHANPGIRYFSGSATYSKTIQIPETAMALKPRIELDLGTVHEVAEVAVNGKTAGVAWKPPYRVDITDAVTAGANTLSIKVVNLWPNRLIGDQQPGAAKVAFAPDSKYKANSPLMPSGLMGPVVVYSLTEIK